LSLGVALLITAGAFVTALGRMSLGPPETTLRYVTPVCVFWTCGVLLALTEAATFRESSSGIAAVLAAAITGLIVTIVPLHLDNTATFLQSVRTSQNAEVALRADVATEQIALIYPDPAGAFALADVLRAHHKSLFAGNPIAIEEPLPPEYQVVSPDRCRGIWEFTTAFESASKPGERVSGWAWDNTANRRPRMMVFLDDAKMTRGFAAFTAVWEGTAHNGRMPSSDWFGFAKRPQANHPYRAFALLNDGRSLCEIGNATVSKPVYAIFRRGGWFIDSNRTGTWEPADRSFRFGLEDDVPVSGDWDGSGVTRAGVFRKGIWYLDWNNSGEWDDGDRQVAFGLPGDLPVVGDWNHTGVTKLGVFRNGTWVLDWNGDQRPGPGNRTFVFGTTGDIPVAGDWDGSGVTRIGIFRRGTWFLDTNGDFQLDSQDKTATFGLAADQPVPGDWNGAGVTRLGVFRKGQWILDSNGNRHWDPEDAVITFGLPGDIGVTWK
jgi:hypothetical protein